MTIQETELAQGKSIIKWIDQYSAEVDILVNAEIVNGGMCSVIQVTVHPHNSHPRSIVRELRDPTASRAVMKFVREKGEIR